MSNDPLWLLITTAVALLAGGVSGWLAAVLARREERKRRIREEVMRWSNPIFGAVDSLHYRLRNVLGGLYPALDSSQRDAERPIDPDWSVDHSYALESTLFLFGQYFAWIRLLQQEMRFELFPSTAAKDEFFSAVHAVSSALAKWPHDQVSGAGEDAQVFILQQRAIGEALILREDGPVRVMSYAEFLAARESDVDGALSRTLKPLESLVMGVAPESKRWARLQLAREALMELRRQCDQLLGLDRTG
jgi:hypothetical protein